MITSDFISGIRERFYRRSPGVGSVNLRNNRQEVFQSEFLSQLDPYGHTINDPTVYENIFKRKPVLDKDDKPTRQHTIIEIPIERVAIAMQATILAKQLTHLCGEKTKFTLMDINPSESTINNFIELKQGWDISNMETAKYEFVKSVKATGDAAFCAVRSKDKFSYKVFSALNGDSLHPIRDFEGKTRIFGRGFYAYDYKREKEVRYMEVWDDIYYTLLTLNKEDKGEVVSWNPETFLPQINADRESGWVVVKPPVAHGFPSCPIEYLKDESGACWTSVQDLIEKLEMALSQLFENNKSYAFRIMIIKGGFSIQGDLRGEARAILMEDKESDAKFMEKADASSSFELQLEQTLKFILMGSFTVLPPESTSGDTPGVTIKIMYSPAIEKGLNDKNFFNRSFNRIFDLFKEGYGLEKRKVLAYNSLSIKPELQIYIHQNDAEVINNEAVAVQAGYRSRETAYENAPGSATDEGRRLEKQRKEDLEYERAGIVGENDGSNPTNRVRQLIAET